MRRRRNASIAGRFAAAVAPIFKRILGPRREKNRKVRVFVKMYISGGCYMIARWLATRSSPTRPRSSA